MRSYEELQSCMEKKGYAFFSDGNYNLNIIFERTHNSFTNQFDDWMHIAYLVDDAKTVKSIPATTKPGLYGDGAVTNPHSGGVAIIVPGQYRHTYKWIPKGKGWSKYPFDGEFFAQQGTVQVWRDWNKDLIIDRAVEQTVDYRAGVDIHKMSNPGAHGFPVNNWSEACSGAEEPCFNEIIPVVEKAVALYGDTFSVTWVETNDFL